MTYPPPYHQNHHHYRPEYPEYPNQGQQHYQQERPTPPPYVAPQVKLGCKMKNLMNEIQSNKR